jgi:hypothetical protein
VVARRNGINVKTGNAISSEFMDVLSFSKTQQMNICLGLNRHHHQLHQSKTSRRPAAGGAERRVLFIDCSHGTGVEGANRRTSHHSDGIFTLRGQKRF